GSGNPFWASVTKGAEEEAKKLGVKLILVAPPQEGDVQAQINQVEDQLAKGVDALALAPGDPNAFAPIVDDAIKSGVPVVFVDTKGINEGVTFIGTNNMNGAELAAKFICDKTPKGSDVAILTGIESQSTALLRRDGAIKGFKNCGLNIVATQTAEWDTAKGRSVTESIILKNPNIKAIFASNDNMGLGAMQALKDADMNDVVVVGFDATPDAATSILKGEMTATIAQFSYNMGAYGVKYALELANGGSIDPNIDTGTQLVTKENANDFK
ncbi:sugar ABC transporter substrate-binding protein, partial [Candidatus Pelagibacter sp.]|nr:sugar ABC transporter substrate-binding protein [Candidatus Pelagibacter sp.]